MKRQTASINDGLAQEWARMGMRFPADRLDRRVAAHARNMPDAIAVVADDVCLTWHELDEAAHGLAAWLHANGLRTGHRIGWLARNGAEFPVLLTAAWRLGLTVAGFNWRLSAGELRAVLSHVDVDFVVADDASAAKLPENLPVLAVGRPFFEAAATAGRVGYRVPRPDDVAAIVFTSGSSGLPKPVIYGRESFERQICGPTTLGFDAASRLLIIAPQFHSAGWIWTAYGLIGGWPQIVQSGADPAVMLAAVEKHHVTHAQWLPTMLHLALIEQQARPRDLSTLRMIAYGASPIAPQLLAAVMEEFTCGFTQVYGLTETIGPIGHLPPSAHRRKWGAAGAPAALANPGVEVRIVDADRGPTGAEAAGEIEVRLPFTPPDYLRDGRTVPVANEDGWIATGDLGFRDSENFIHVIGRMGDMIISGGENVYPAEVENLLLEFADIDQVAVFPTPDPLWGQSINAAIVPCAGSTPSAAEVIARCRERIAHYKVPKRVVFMESLPRNATGKVLRGDLATLLSG